VLRMCPHRTLVASAIAALAISASLSAAHADEFVDKIKAEIAQLSHPQTTWDGPTSSAKATPGKLVVFESVDEQNDAAVKYGDGVKEAAAKIGWKVVVVDGRGNPSAQQEATNQGIALKPDALIITSDAEPLKQQIKEAVSRGIVVVGIHAAATPGPQPNLGLFVNVQTDPVDIGRAEADWIIANSDGKARVVVTTDCLYAIACTKAHATEQRIKECKTCSVLEFSSTPSGEVQQRMPSLVAAWVQKYGTPIYITSVADFFVDFQAPALRAGGVDSSQGILVAADGTKAAYQRIRAGGQYQQVTIPEPTTLQAYQTIDEIIRAMNKMPPSGFKQKPYLVSHDNVDIEGGANNGYDPSNDYREHYLKIWGASGG
jgi:ribose transport system substrate-binding protein